MRFDFPPERLSLRRTPAGLAIDLAHCVQPETVPGTPWLPVRYANLRIPDGARVTAATFTGNEVKVQGGADIRPAQPQSPHGMPRLVAVPKDAVAYASAQRYPTALGEVVGVHSLRGHTFASVELHPVRYVGATRELFLSTEITVELAVESSKQKSLAALRPHEPRFEAFVNELVENPSVSPPTERGTVASFAEDETVDYLVITSAALADAFQTLANHRAARGLSASVVTVEAIVQAYGGTDTQDKIRNCIKDHVASHGTAFVVLGGDNTVVPDRDCYVAIGSYVESRMPTDLYYSGLDGTWDDRDDDGVYGEADVNGIGSQDEGDLAPDVFVGRIPVRTADQALAYIGKVVAYENDPLPPSFVSSALLAGVTLWDTYTGDDRPSDAVADGHAPFRSQEWVSDAEMWGRRMYRDGVYPFWQADRLGLLFDSLSTWDGGTAGDYALSRDHLAARLNEGWHFVSVDTHGASTLWSMESYPSFASATAAALQNLTAVVYTMACNTGAFDTAEPSLSEAFLRNGNGGALAYMGCSRYGWGGPDAPPASPVSDGGTSSAYEYEFWRQVLEEHRTVLGEAFALHKAAKASACGADYAYRWVQFGMNLQGDPALTLRPWQGVHLTEHTLRVGGVRVPTLEPGDSAELTLVLRNEDAFPVALAATLTTPNAHIGVQEPAVRDYLLAAGGSGTNSAPFVLSIDAECPDGTTPCGLVLTNNTLCVTQTVSIAVQRRPRFACSPTPLALVVRGGTPTETTLVVTNRGTGAMSFAVAGSADYRFLTNDDPGGPAFDWIDISETGTRVVLGDDDVSPMIPMGFEFPFYGKRYSSFEIGSNGGIGLEPGYLDGNHQPLPCLAHNAPGPFIAALWTELDALPSGEVRYHTDGHRLVVSFLSVPRLLEPNDKVTFQAVLDDTGRIRLHYQTIQGPAWRCTVGIQAGNLPARALQICHNEPFVRDGLAVEIGVPAPVDWLTLSPAAGSIDGGGYAILDITAQPIGQSTNTSLHVWHNDTTVGCLSEVPVSVQIEAPAPGTCLLLR